MRGDEFRKPRHDRWAREAEEAEARLISNAANETARKANNEAAFEMIARATRMYLSDKQLSSSFLALLLDKVRLEFRKLREERGVDDSRLDKPFNWGWSGRDPLNSEEGVALAKYLKGDGPRPDFWFGEGPQASTDTSP